MTRSIGAVAAALRWLMLVALLAALGAGTILDTPTRSDASAAAKEKGHGKGAPARHDEDDDDDDDDDGGGDDDDDDGGDDDDGNGNGDEKKDDKEPKNKNKGKGNGNQRDVAPETVRVLVVQPARGYRVTVGCYADGELGRSTCVFAGVATSDEDSVDGLAVPEAAVCAPVIDGDFARGDGETPGDLAGRSTDAAGADWYAVGSGYRGPAFVSEDQPGVVTLVLEGAVSTDGTTTYWLRTPAGVAAAAGPGLRCGPAEPAGDQLAAVATGSIVIQALACQFPNAPADDPDFDWFAACAQPATGATFELTALDGGDAGSQLSAATDADGVHLADDLVPGRYRVVQIDANWCHAESDSVDDAGDIVVTAGERASVWIFNCDVDATATATPAPK